MSTYVPYSFSASFAGAGELKVNTLPTKPFANVTATPNTGQSRAISMKASAGTWNANATATGWTIAVDGTDNTVLNCTPAAVGSELSALTNAVELGDWKDGVSYVSLDMAAPSAASNVEVKSSTGGGFSAMATSKGQFAAIYQAVGNVTTVSLWSDSTATPTSSAVTAWDGSAADSGNGAVTVNSAMGIVPFTNQNLHTGFAGTPTSGSAALRLISMKRPDATAATAWSSNTLITFAAGAVLDDYGYGAITDAYSVWVESKTGETKVHVIPAAADAAGDVKTYPIANGTTTAAATLGFVTGQGTDAYVIWRDSDSNYYASDLKGGTATPVVIPLPKPAQAVTPGCCGMIFDGAFNVLTVGSIVSNKMSVQALKIGATGATWTTLADVTLSGGPSMAALRPASGNLKYWVGIYSSDGSAGNRRLSSFTLGATTTTAPTIATISVVDAALTAVNSNISSVGLQMGSFALRVSSGATNAATAGDVNIIPGPASFNRAVAYNTPLPSPSTDSSGLSDLALGLIIGGVILVVLAVGLGVGLYMRNKKKKKQ